MVVTNNHDTRISASHPVSPCAITRRYTSSTQSRDALRVQPRLPDETPSPRFVLSLPLSLPLSITRFIPLYIDFSPLHRHSPPSSPCLRTSSLSLSRQIATITYMCQYITHPCWPRLPHNPLSKPASTPLCPSPRLPIYRTNKVHRYESSVFRRCSHPIPHLRLSIPLRSSSSRSLFLVSFHSFVPSSPSRSLWPWEGKSFRRLADFLQPPFRRANGTFFISGFSSCRDLIEDPVSIRCLTQLYFNKIADLVEGTVAQIKKQRITFAFR